MEYEFRVNETARPIFLKDETREAALATLSMLGYTLREIQPEDNLSAHLNSAIDHEDITLELDTQNQNINGHNALTAEYDPLAFLNDITPEVELDFTERKQVSSPEPKSIKPEITQVECDSCPNEQYEDNPITGKRTSTLKPLSYYGRSLLLCDTCYAKELPVAHLKQDTTYGNNLNDKIERVVASTIDVSQIKWQELYYAERPAWILANFNSVEEMRDKLISFICEMEGLVFQTKAKMRAAYDSARELEANLSKEQRAALINDPNFKVPENSQYKKAAVRMSAEEKSRKALKDQGMTDEMIDAFLGKVK